MNFVFLQDIPMYLITQSTATGQDAAQFFFLSASTGVISVRKPLTESNTRQYTVSDYY